MRTDLTVPSEMFANRTLANNYVIYPAYRPEKRKNTIRIEEIPLTTALSKIKVNIGYNTTQAAFTTTIIQDLKETFNIKNYGQFLAAIIQDRPELDALVLRNRNCYRAVEVLRVFKSYLITKNWNPDFKIPPILKLDKPISSIKLDPEKYNTEFVNSLDKDTIAAVRKLLVSQSSLDSILLNARKKALEKKINDASKVLETTKTELSKLQAERQLLK